jgi:hypothetical protein
MTMPERTDERYICPRQPWRRSLVLRTIQLWDCNGTGAQNWTIAGDGSIQALGKCMDVTYSGTTNGTKVQLWDCNGTGAQRWSITGAGDIVNPQSNRCLDATGVSSANGTRLQIWDCHGGANQKWTTP